MQKEEGWESMETVKYFQIVWESYLCLVIFCLFVFKHVKGLTHGLKGEENW